jgi:phosphate transport system ATP-binding protein
VQSLNLWIDERQVLRNLSFKVPKNLITAIIGTSGSGKSVLLKAMVHLLAEEVQPQILRIHGDIRFAGRSVFALRSRTSICKLRRRIAFVSQLPIAFPMSIFENVSLGIDYWRPTLRKKARESLVEKSLRTAGLWSEVDYRLRGCEKFRRPAPWSRSL